MIAEFLAFQALLNILSDLKTAQNTPVFSIVEEFTGQYEDEEGNPLWDAPAALIEMIAVDWEDDVNKREQYGQLDFRIHIVDDCSFDNTKRRLLPKHATNVGHVAKGLRHKVVHLSDLGVTAEGILLNAISRKRTEFVNELSENVVTILNFNTFLVDYSAVPSYTEILAQLEINYYFAATQAEFETLVSN
jgi:hypothetical protein